MNTHLPVWPFIERAEVIEVEDCEISSWSCHDAKYGVWEFKTDTVICGKTFGPWYVFVDDVVVQLDDQGGCKLNLAEWDDDASCWYPSDKLATFRFLMTRPLTVNEVFKAA